MGRATNPYAPSHEGVLKYDEQRFWELQLVESRRDIARARKAESWQALARLKTQEREAFARLNEIRTAKDPLDELSAEERIDQLKTALATMPAAVQIELYEHLEGILGGPLRVIEGGSGD